MVRTSLVLLLLSWAYVVNAQVNRYAVFFTDKDGTPYSLDTPGAFLSSRAIERRTNQGIPYIENDLPVNPSYLTGLAEEGAEVFFASKWLNAALVQVDDGLVASIEALDYVNEIRLIGLGERLSSGSRKRTHTSNRIMSGTTFAQLNQIGITNLHAEGFRGEGLLMAIFDSGFIGVETTSPFNHIFSENALVDSYNFVLNNDNPYELDDHGTEVLSVIGAVIEDQFLGAAPDADFVLYITEDDATEYPIEEFNWLVAAERADSVGVDIINSSLGYNTFDASFDDYQFEDLDGNTTIISRAADLAASKGILVVTSAGNEGNSNPITAPADADSVISVGYVSSSGTIVLQSSSGPSADGQIKPEVVARGVSVSVINEFGNIDTSSGTSFSAPLVAGLAACIWQSKPGFTNMQLRDTILAISDRVDNPDNLYGYGLPQYGDIQITSLVPRTETDVVVYPNPVQDNSFSIKGLTIPPELIEINLINLHGIRFNLPIKIESNNELTVEIRDLKSGIYFLEIKTGDKIDRIKILKE